MQRELTERAESRLDDVEGAGHTDVWRVYTATALFTLHVRRRRRSRRRLRRQRHCTTTPISQSTAHYTRS